MLELNAVERSNAAAIGETLRNLSIRAEVGSVMEGMLGDLEAWEWANTEEMLKKELEHMRAQVAALKESERLLLQVTVLSCAHRSNWIRSSLIELQSPWQSLLFWKH